MKGKVLTKIIYNVTIRKWISAVNPENEYKLKILEFEE